MNQSSKSYRIEIVTLITLFSIWLVNLLLVLIILTKTLDDHQPDLTIKSSGHVPGNAVCVPCEHERREDNGTAASTFAKKAVVSIDNVQMCCDDRRDDLIYLLHVVMAWQSIEETTTDASTDIGTRSSAQLFMDQKHFEGTSITWSVEPGYDSGHVEGGLRLINNSIVVQDGGLYHIQSSLNFFTRNSNDDVTGTYVTHSIIRTNIEEQISSEVLLSKSSSLPYKSGRFITSVLEEFINISRGDIISVTLSNYSYIYNFSVSNSFGIYRLK